MDKLYRNIKHVTFVIHPVYGNFDVIAIGDIGLLRKLSKREKYFHLLKQSKFGGIPVLVMDTCDTLRGAMNCIKEYSELSEKIGH